MNGYGCECPPALPGTPGNPLVTAASNARAQTQQSATGRTIGFEPLIIACPAPLGGHYWLVTQIQALFTVTNPPQDPPFGPGSSPACGLFLTPSQDIGETLGQAVQDMNDRTRAIGLDTSINATFIVATGLYKVQYVWRSGAGPLVVPQGFQLIAIMTPHPGTPQPGPGPASFGQINALVSSEVQQ